MVSKSEKALMSIAVNSRCFKVEFMRLWEDAENMLPFVA